MAEEEDCFADYIWNSAGELVKDETTGEVQDECDYNSDEDGRAEEINDEDTMELDQAIEEEILEPIVIGKNENENSLSDVAVVQEQLVEQEIKTSERQLGNK